MMLEAVAAGFDEAVAGQSFHSVESKSAPEGADLSEAWVRRYIVGNTVTNQTAYEDDDVAYGHSLWSQTFGSTTFAQNFLAIMDGAGKGTGSGRAAEAVYENLGDTGDAALHTHEAAEAGFHADARLRIWIKAGNAVRGGGGKGGRGGSDNGAGKSNPERVSGGGGGAGARWYKASDMGLYVGGEGGLNINNPFGGPTGLSATRTVAGGVNTAIITSASASEDGENGDHGKDAINLLMDVEILNEGLIYGGGGGGGGSDTDGLSHRSYPGSGGTPGVAGSASTDRDGSPPDRAGGAAGKAIALNGNTVTWISDLLGTAGTTGTLLGAIS